MLAVFVLTLEAKVDPAINAAVGALLIRIGASGCGVEKRVSSPYTSVDHELPPRGPGSGVLEHLRGHLYVTSKYIVSQVY
jgi:hypothetical protein